MYDQENETFELDPVYMIAVMKVQRELKRHEFEGLDQLIEQSMEELGVDEQSLDEYLEENRDDLVKIVETVGI